MTHNLLMFRSKLAKIDKQKRRVDNKYLLKNIHNDNQGYYYHFMPIFPNADKLKEDPSTCKCNGATKNKIGK